MLLGVPIIIPNLFGCKDYANDDNCTLLEPEGFILHSNMDGYPQFNQKKWGFISVRQIREKMRFALTNQNIIKNKSVLAEKENRVKFSYIETVQKFTKIIEAIS